MDFGFRQYDPQIGRFLGVDPLADYYGQDRYSPYAAMGNQPESMIDPNGLSAKMSTAHGVASHNADIGGGGGENMKEFSPEMQAIKRTASKFLSIFASSLFSQGQGSTNVNDVGIEVETLTDIYPTKYQGGRFTKYEDFIDFMLTQAKENDVEVSALKLKNEKYGEFYIVFSWYENKINESQNTKIGKNIIPDGVEVFKDLQAQYHTHPMSTGPSYDDALLSKEWGVPVFTIGADRKVWQTNRYYSIPGDKIPPILPPFNPMYNLPTYGRIVKEY